MLLHKLAGPDGSSVSSGACNLGVPGSNPGRDGYLSSWLCIYTALQAVQAHGVYSAAYGTVYYKEPLKSFEIRVGHSPGFVFPSVAILLWWCRKRRKAIFIYIYILAQAYILWRTYKYQDVALFFCLSITWAFTRPIVTIRQYGTEFLKADNNKINITSARGKVISYNPIHN